MYTSISDIPNPELIYNEKIDCKVLYMTSLKFKQYLYYGDSGTKAALMDLFFQFLNFSATIDPIKNKYTEQEIITYISEIFNYSKEECKSIIVLLSKINSLKN